MDENSFEETEIKGAADADFYVVEDQYNELYRYHIIETCPRKLTVALIEALGGALAAFPQWWCNVVLGDSRVQVFSECVIPYVRRFWDWATVEEFPMARPGEWTMDPRQSREWEAVRAALAQDSGGARDSYLHQSRHVLHPQIRLAYVMRFLARPVPLEPVADDAGLLMAELGEPTASTLCAGLTGMQTTYLGTDNQDAFYFWTNVEYGIRKHPEKELQEPAIARLREHLHSLLHTAGSDLIRLSAVLGLAADAEWLAAQRKWPAAMTRWVQQVGAGGYAYPMDDWNFRSLH